MDQTGSNPQQVRRRRVFYIPGYDPIHPRRYRELYRKESAAQAEVSGYSLTLSPKQTKGPYGWHAAAEMDGQRSESDIEVLVWSDIVRGSMDATIAGTYWLLVRTAWIYISTGALRRLTRLRKGPVIAAFYPVGMLLLQALLALLLASGLARACGILAGLLSLGGPLTTFMGWSLGLGGGYALLRWFKKRDGKFFAYYLMHDYAHTAATRGAIAPEMEVRMGQFRALIAEALQDQNVDEVLVVGHSSGAHLGVSVLADLIRDGLPPERPALGFLTLGQVVPMVSFLPRARRLRGDLQYLCQREELAWVDVTAPGDGCAFALCDPVSVSGVAPAGKRWPLVFSAAFTQTLSPDRWKQLRWRFFRLHFQYLCAFDRPGDYDYFRITAGPLTLAERYRNRKPSKSRIDVPVSKFTSVAAE
ncbi:hypothetical protein N6L27_02540 [Leisingera sp. SS27]|uniref:hypothetical protein n=1 Tax=Leisingera sp. SS27 TaxID=2979462 RepID=UPI00232F0099|nr:hypothetical protein [Leisingera sp. SS27]MDC0656872.1 hypothetical protein [Leisingera sp. SS27]